MTDKQKPAKGLNISAKSFLSALIIIFALMIVTYVLTFLIPSGAYERAEDGSITNPDAFSYTEDGGLPFWKWILSPFLVLGAPSGGGTLAAILVFLLVIGGVFEALARCGLMKYILEKLTVRFGHRRYTLMAVIVLFFMSLGSLIGSFEECVPLVPIVTALAVNLGWDVITGMGMSMLAVGCGFAAGVFNPFTVGVAQKLAGLTMFSGVWLRLLAFVLIYGLLFLCLRLHARRVERPIDTDAMQAAFVKDKKLERGTVLFASILGAGILCVLLSGFITALQDYTMIIVAVMFLAAGIAATLACGMSGKQLGAAAGSGIVGMLPAVLMILMAASIRYTMEEAGIMDTVLHGAVTAAAGMPRYLLILFIYALVLGMNFFIASGSAKAFMIMPLIVPMAEMFGIPAQLCVVAYAFGDGFSNVFYPTNPALLISLGLSGTSYGRWAKWSWKFQLCNLLLTSALLLLGLAVGYC